MGEGVGARYEMGENGAGRGVKGGGGGCCGGECSWDGSGGCGCERSGDCDC